LTYAGHKLNKTVIICEGEHDVLLLSMILEHARKSYKKLFWKDIQKASSKNQEIVTIRQFLGHKGKGCEYLIKQDNNADDAVRSFFDVYKTSSDFSLKLVTDSDGDAGLRHIRRLMTEKLGHDVLQNDEKCENILRWKSNDWKPAVFFYPKIDGMKQGKLTDIVADAGCGNLAGCREIEKKKTMLEKYLLSREKWITDLERFLLDDDS